MQEPLLYIASLLYLAGYFIARKSIRATTGKSLSLFNVLGVVLEAAGVLVRRLRKLPTYSKNQDWREVLGLMQGSPTPGQVKLAGDRLLEQMRVFSFAYPYPQLAVVKQHIRMAESSAWTTIELAEEDLMFREADKQRTEYMLSLSPRQLAVVMLQDRGYGHCDCRPAMSSYRRGFRRGLSPYSWY